MSEKGDDPVGRRGPVGGRFVAPPDDLFQRFSSSLAVDLRMLDEDVEGSIAHATMLGEVGILTADEARTFGIVDEVISKRHPLDEKVEKLTPVS